MDLKYMWRLNVSLSPQNVHICQSQCMKDYTCSSVCSAEWYFFHSAPENAQQIQSIMLISNQITKHHILSLIYGRCYLARKRDLVTKQTACPTTSTDGSVTSLINRSPDWINQNKFKGNKSPCATPAFVKSLIICGLSMHRTGRRWDHINLSCYSLRSASNFHLSRVPGYCPLWSCNVAKVIIIISQRALSMHSPEWSWSR